MILEERDEQVIYKDENGKIITIPNSDYYWTKHIKFQDRRIGWIFSDDCYVKETFDNRIFNCWCYGKRLQLRQDLSDNLCEMMRNSIKGVLEEDEQGVVRKYDALTPYKILFNQIQKEVPNMEMLRYYLAEIMDVKITEKGVCVKSGFMIDYNGNAWVKKENHEYSSLCLVMRGNNNNRDLEFPMSDGKLQFINSLTMTILSKIMFLLNPNLQDRVFTNQLSSENINRLRDE